MNTPEPNQRGQKQLLRYFDDVYCPLELSGRSKNTITRYRTAIKNLDKYNNNPTKIANITGLMLARFGQWCGERGISAEVVGKYKRYIRMVVRHARPDAFPKGARFNRGAKVPYRRNSLAKYFEDVYRVENQTLSESTLDTYATAISKLCTFAQRDVSIGEVHPTLIAEFRNWCRLELTEQSASQYIRDILTVFEAANPEAYFRSSHRWNCEYIDYKNEPQPRKPSVPTPNAPEGSLLHFLHYVYAPARLDLQPQSLSQLDMTVRQFDLQHGGHVMLSDLSDELVILFMRSMIGARLAPRTINGKRNNIIGLWNYAFRKGYVETAVRDVPRVKEPSKVPQAWTMVELERILTAAAGLKGKLRSGIPKSRFWLAYILVAYDTGLRLSDVLALRWDAIREDRTFVVRQQKTGDEHVVCLSDQATEAIQALPKLGELVFPWRGQREQFHKHWRRLIASAGFPATKTNGTHKLRRTSATQLETVAPGTATYHLGHRTPDLARASYIDPTIARPDNAAKLLPRPKIVINQ